MKKLAALAVVAVAAVAMSASTASAQSNFQGQVGGYSLGVGLNQAGIQGFGGFRNTNRRGVFGGGLFGAGIGTPRAIAPPYFAQFPPVYYSGIVKRPYGISPYAAPAGIAPVELSIPKPMNVKNPFFKPEVEVQPVVDEVPVPAESLDGKSTWIKNPYGGRNVSK